MIGRILAGILYGVFTLQALALWDGAVYVQDGASVEVTWDAYVIPEDYAGWTLTGYRVWQEHLETGQQFPAVTVTGTTAVMPKVKTGHFKYYVAAVLRSADGVEEFSEPATSLDPGNPIMFGGVEKRKGGWVVFMRPSPPVIK